MGQKQVASCYILLKKNIVIPIGGVIVFITYLANVPNFVESVESNHDKGISSISFAMW
jgi:hypothetical protein